jgi:hypothetical protein
MNKLIQHLLIIKKNKSMPLDKATKLGINVNELKNKGFVSVKTVKNENFNVPKGVPRYAARFGFTRRKYGIETVLSEQKNVSITENGIKMIKKSVKKEVEEQPVKKPPVKDTEDSHEVQDQ